MFDGKYAEFIVPAFAITAVVFAGMVAFSLNHARRWKRRFEDFDRMGQDRAGGDRVGGDRVGGDRP